MTVNIEELSYKELIELEKQIQKEKTKKVQHYITKSDLYNSENLKTIFDILDKRFQDEKYGWPQKCDVDKFHWDSEEEKEEARNKNYPAPVAENLHDRLHSSFLYICDIAFQNYHDHYLNGCNTTRNYYKAQSGPNDDNRYYTVTLNKEIPWQKSQKYKSMYEEMTNIFLKYSEET